jgi:predicted RND superfamily exporter protein
MQQYHEKTATRHKLVVAGSLMLFAVLLWVNTFVQKGGILDDPIRDTTNPAYQEDKHQREVFPDATEPVLFTFEYKQGVDERALREVTDYHHKLERAFPEASVYSIANHPYYKDNGEEMISERYTNPTLAQFQWEGKFSSHYWANEVSADPGVFGVLVDRRATSLSIALFPPKGYDEMAFYRKVAAFVEERETSPLEWFIKHDIYPVQKNLHVSGGIVGRGVVDGMANFENTSKSQVGLVLALVALVGFLGSPRQAGISLFLIVLSMLGARGSIAVLSELGFGFRETVFFSLVMANILVQGFSFNLRMFEKWNEAHRRDKLATREKVWKSVGENIRGMLFLVGFMSILNFLILSRTEVRPLFEVAILSALGICFSLLPALFLLPSLHLVLGGVPKHGGRLAFLSRFF